MNSNFPGLLLAVIGFIAAFGVARALAKWLKQRRARRSEEVASQNQSRQVRRAKERAGNRPR
jgi:Flp pilus assembly protein TadB